MGRAVPARDKREGRRGFVCCLYREESSRGDRRHFDCRKKPDPSGGGGPHQCTYWRLPRLQTILKFHHKSQSEGVYVLRDMVRDD